MNIWNNHKWQYLLTKFQEPGELIHHRFSDTYIKFYRIACISRIFVVSLETGGVQKYLVLETKKVLKREEKERSNENYNKC